MPYFPKTYPQPNWWAGKMFVIEAMRLLQTADRTTMTNDINKLIFRNLMRGIRTLMLLPAELGIEESEKQLHIALPDGWPWGENCKDPKEALMKTRDFFYRWYHNDRYDEYTYYGWDEIWDADYISEIIGLSVCHTERLLEDNSFTEAQLALLMTEYKNQVDSWIEQDFDRYWEMDEYELLSHFGEYGEFRGFPLIF